MASQEIISVLMGAIQSIVRQPIGGPRILIDSDEQVALHILDAIESAGMEIVRRAPDPTD